MFNKNNTFELNHSWNQKTKLNSWRKKNTSKQTPLQGADLVVFLEGWPWCPRKKYHNHPISNGKCCRKSALRITNVVVVVVVAAAAAVVVVVVVVAGVVVVVAAAGGVVVVVVGGGGGGVGIHTQRK